MRVLCGMLGLLALGLVSGTAVAGLSGTVGPGAITGTISVTTPSVTTPTVTVTLPVTTVTSPTTVPTLPVTVTVPTTTAVTVPTTTAVTTTPLPVTTTAPAVTTTAPRVTTTVPTVTSPVPLPVTTAPQATTAGTDPGSTGTISAPAASPGGRTATAPAPRPAPSTSAGDTWAGGAGDAAIGSSFATPDRRALVLRFRLDRSGPIRVTVLRMASGCRVVGSFGIPGRAGSNALRFDDTLGALRLRAGVYEVRLQSPGAVSRRIWVRISAARRLSIVAPQTRCATPGAAGPVGLGATWPPLAGSADGPGAAEGPRAGVASARFARTGSEEGRNAFSPNGLASELSRNPFALLLLGLAALLVAIAAIPRGVIPAGRLRALVADRRVELVSVGATVFVTAVLTLALA